eukprot:365987-Chlamydomonas_euryale.AAC.32
MWQHVWCVIDVAALNAIDAFRRDMYARAHPPPGLPPGQTVLRCDAYRPSSDGGARGAGGPAGGGYPPCQPAQLRACA